MTSPKYDILIIGAGHSGAQAAIMLRQLKYEGTIGIIGAEPYLPYERPPLSKEYFSGEKSFERIMVRPEAFWTERAIEFQLNERVVAVDSAKHEVATDAGRSVGYGTLIWAAGGEPRTLSIPGADLNGVHMVRTRDDSDAILAGIETAQHIAIIGGGYIGLEAAAVLSGKFGKSVTLFEALPHLLARVAGEPLSLFFEQEHRAHGVDIRLNADVIGLEGEDGRVRGIALGDGSVVPADLVVVGIGISPSIAPLVAAGAAADNGVLVDAHCRTTLPDIYAIGDCAAHPNPFAGDRVIRLESIQNANDQANLVARAIVGDAQPYRATPWFWSNQYDVKLQTVGIAAGYDEMVVRGSVSDRSFSVIYLKDGKVIALDCVNAVKDYVQGRKLVETGAVIDPTRLADSSVLLKEMLG